MLIGTVEAFAAMVLYSFAGLLQAAGSENATRRRPVFLQTAYLGGLVVDFLAWLCAVLVLQQLPVFAVQAIIGGSIAITPLFGAWRVGVSLPTTSRVAVGSCLAGLVLVAASAGSDQQPVHSPLINVVLVVGVLLLGLAALTLRTGSRAWPLALVAGMGFGGSALAIRAAHVQAGAGIFDPVALLSQPSTYLVIGYWAVGIVSYTAALSRGDLGAVTAVYLVTQVLVPGMVGIFLLDDPVRPGWQWVLAPGLALAVAGTVQLAKAPQLRKPRPQRPHQLPAARPTPADAIGPHHRTVLDSDLADEPVRPPSNASQPDASQPDPFWPDVSHPDGFGPVGRPSDPVGGDGAVSWPPFVPPAERNGWGPPVGRSGPVDGFRSMSWPPFIRPAESNRSRPVDGWPDRVDDASGPPIVPPTGSNRSGWVSRWTDPAGRVDGAPWAPFVPPVDPLADTE